MIIKLLSVGRNIAFGLVPAAAIILLALGLIVFGFTQAIPTAAGYPVFLVAMFVAQLMIVHLRINVNRSRIPFLLAVNTSTIAFAFTESNPYFTFSLWAIGIFLVQFYISIERVLVSITAAASIVVAGFVFLSSYQLITSAGIVVALFPAVLCSIAFTTLSYFLTIFTVDEQGQKTGTALSPRWSQLLVATVLYLLVGNIGLHATNEYLRVFFEQVPDYHVKAFFFLATGIALYSVYQRYLRNLLMKRFNGVVEAALSLPWAGDQDVLRKLRDFTRKTIPALGVLVRTEPPGENEIGAVVTIPDRGDQYLIVHRGRGAAPFTLIEQRVIDALAHMGTETMRTIRETTDLSLEARSDSLTGLLNFRGFQDEMERTRQYPERVAVLYIDLDDFKLVNDNYGHKAGNEALVMVAERIRASIRPSDIAARVGGDEFVVILRTVSDPDQAEGVVRRMNENLSAPFQTSEGIEITISASIGISFTDVQDKDIDDLLVTADENMYHNKRARSELLEEHGELFSEISANLGTDLERIIADAITEERIRIAFQPIVRLSDCEITGFEALVRYEHHEAGEIPPQLIINIARQLSLLDALTEQVLQRSYIRMAEFQKIAPSIGHLHVNFSTEQVKVKNLQSVVKSLEARYPDITLGIELTEGSLHRSKDESVVQTLQELTTDRVLFSLDDFGRSYSTVRAMLNLPIDIVKFDKSLVQDVTAQGDNENPKILLRGLVSVFKELNNTVIIEGVETREMAEIAEAIGADKAQGYFFGRPMFSEEVVARLKEFGSKGICE